MKIKGDTKIWFKRPIVESAEGHTKVEAEQTEDENIEEVQPSEELTIDIIWRISEGEDQTIDLDEIYQTKT